MLVWGGCVWGVVGTLRDCHAAGARAARATLAPEHRARTALTQAEKKIEIQCNRPEKCEHRERNGRHRKWTRDGGRGPLRRRRRPRCDSGARPARAASASTLTAASSACVTRRRPPVALRRRQRSHLTALLAAVCAGAPTLAGHVPAIGGEREAPGCCQGEGGRSTDTLRARAAAQGVVIEFRPPREIILQSHREQQPTSTHAPHTGAGVGGALEENADAGRRR